MGSPEQIKLIWPDQCCFPVQNWMGDAFDIYCQYCKTRYFNKFKNPPDSYNFY